MSSPRAAGKYPGSRHVPCLSGVEFPAMPPFAARALANWKRVLLAIPLMCHPRPLQGRRTAGQCREISGGPSAEPPESRRRQMCAKHRKVGHDRRRKPDSRHWSLSQVLRACSCWLAGDGRVSREGGHSHPTSLDTGKQRLRYSDSHIGPKTGRVVPAQLREKRLSR